MVATFTDFDSTMAHTVVVDTERNTVDVTFFNRTGSAGNTYRYNLSNAEVNDIISICVARSKGQLLHQMLDIRKGVRLDTVRSQSVSVPQVAPKVVSNRVKSTLKQDFNPSLGLSGFKAGPKAWDPWGASRDSILKIPNQSFITSNNGAST